ncbi:hypothetical protein BMS_2174 [Halobacteriovorax marinus SJ]|uniref:Uncharacterized protein n=1 Tax=Halobacteriovorax marinus (strain ATCC BAA-682 / DSM 15412 / SJ) TaxID=862908 RepID=E1X3Q1_HALMS|nr:hypothetical protein [Halobacteriovorax marinus]CBW26980.1 hypothetical protein BMS_2174 [Halobacteriovorax marinus SJ]
MKLLGLFLFLISLYSFSFEKSEAFIVTAYTNKFKVLSPVKRTNKVSVIIENKTLVKLIGEVVTDKGVLKEMVTIKPGKYKSVELEFYKNSKYYFIPLSPSFQKVVLDFGRKAYEIPSKE